jgi:hypothetical protein
MTRLDVLPKRNIEWRSAIAIGRYDRCANESFSRAIAGRMALMIIKKLNPERSIWGAVQAPLNGCPTATTRRGGKDRIILQIVWTDVGIAVVISRDAAGAIEWDRQINPETAIGKNGVTQDTVAGCKAAAYYYAGVICITRSTIKRHDIACARLRAAYDTGRSANNTEARRISQRVRTCNVGTDGVAFDASCGEND